MIDAVWAREFAADWIAAWNSHDLDRILAYYADDFEMTSPFILERTGTPSGRLKGKAAVGAYWRIGLAATPPLHFELIDVLPGVSSMVLYYRSLGRKMAAEVLVFDEAMLIVSGIAHHRDP